MTGYKKFTKSDLIQTVAALAVIPVIIIMIKVCMHEPHNYAGALQAYQNGSIQPSMTVKEVRAICGRPTHKQFDKEGHLYFVVPELEGVALTCLKYETKEHNPIDGSTEKVYFYFDSSGQLVGAMATEKRSYYYCKYGETKYRSY